MTIGLLLFLTWTALEVVLVAGCIAWCLEQGQFKNIEDAKYTMLEDHQPEAWPTGEKSGTSTR